MKSSAGADTLSTLSHIEEQDQDQEDGVPDSFISKSNSPAFITVQDEKGNLEQIPVRYLHSSRQTVIDRIFRLSWMIMRKENRTIHISISVLG